MVEAVATPEETAPATNEQTQAAQKLDAVFDKTLGFDVNVAINKGANIKMFKDGASEDIIRVDVKSDEFTKPGADIDYYAKAMMAQMHRFYTMRDNAILLSPEAYLKHGADEMKFFQDEAVKAGLNLEGVDLSKTTPVRSDISTNQKRAHAAQPITGTQSSSIHVTIGTNPNDREGAENVAEKVAADLKARLPEIKAAMIARIKEKKYAELTPEDEKRLEAHVFEVKVQQQGQWTSVFIEIFSPEQDDVRKNPENRAKYTDEQLERSNILTMVKDADQRAKLAARAVLFQGPDLRKPASYFTDIAGVEDVKSLLKAVIKKTAEKNTDPDFAKRAEALMHENFFISPEQWNLPEQQQATFKQQAYAQLKPGTNELRITLNVPKGKAEEIFKSVAETDIEKLGTGMDAAPAVTADLSKVVDAAIGASHEVSNGATATAAAAAAGAVAVCPDGVAVANAGAEAGADGAQAGANATCLKIDPDALIHGAGEVVGTAAQLGAEAAATAAGAPGLVGAAVGAGVGLTSDLLTEAATSEMVKGEAPVANLNGTEVRNKDIKSFVDLVQRHNPNMGMAQREDLRSEAPRDHNLA